MAMNPAQLEARANQRARDEHVHIFAIPGRPGVYTTKSKSDPAARYTLVSRGGIDGCSCTGYAYRQSCKHLEALRNRLAREATRRAPRAATSNLLYAEGAS
jgi:hypothetical protein